MASRMEFEMPPKGHYSVTEKRDERRCPGCSLFKPTSEFGPDRRVKNGLQSKCRSCCKEYQKKYRKSSEGRATANRRVLIKRYGITPNEYDELLESQNGVCAICLQECKSGRRLAVDHDHKTGAVRGLLCGSCNRAIGNLQDDPEVLQRALDYLRPM